MGQSSQWTIILAIEMILACHSFGGDKVGEGNGTYQFNVSGSFKNVVHIQENSKSLAGVVIIDSEKNVTTCLVAISSSSARPLR
jgi:hypothetical protein